MAALDIRPLSDTLSFGSRVAGVGKDNVNDPSVRARLNALFEDRGVIVFEDVEPSLEMQVAVSELFGPLKGHSYKGITTADSQFPGVMELKRYPGESDIWEVDGVPLAGWVPWHFDACYSSELNRAGVLRVVESPPEGGLTGFADGIQLYRDIDPVLRERFENLEILYHPQLMFTNMRYRRPRRFLRLIHPPQHTRPSRRLPHRLRHPSRKRRLHPPRQHTIHPDPQPAQFLRQRPRHPSQSRLRRRAGMRVRVCDGRRLGAGDTPPYGAAAARPCSRL